MSPNNLDLLGDKLSRHLDPRVTAIVAPSEREHTFAAAVGMRAATGPVLILMDRSNECRSRILIRPAKGTRMAIVTDIVLKPDRIEDLVAVLRLANLEPVQVLAIWNGLADPTRLSADVPAHALASEPIVSYVPSDCPVCTARRVAPRLGSHDRTRLGSIFPSA